MWNYYSIRSCLFYKAKLYIPMLCCIDPIILINFLFYSNHLSMLKLNSSSLCCLCSYCAEYSLDTIKADCTVRQRDWQPGVGLLLVLQGFCCYCSLFCIVYYSAASWLHTSRFLNVIVWFSFSCCHVDDTLMHTLCSVYFTGSFCVK